jgi:signal transduction histidine kinase
MTADLNGSDNDKQPSFWDHLTRPRPYILIALIVIGLIIEICIYYFRNVSAAYTQFFYLIIVIAGLWYQKKAIWIAVVFSALYLLGEFLPPFSLSLDAVFRALMLCLVAIVIGNISYRLSILQNRLNAKNAMLQESHKALEIGNKKLNMLSSITRHDILNQLMGLRIYLEMAKEIEKNPVILDYMKKEDEAAKAIENQISFTRFYQNIGVQAPAWQDVEEHIKSSLIELRIVDIIVDIAFSNLEIYADPLIKKVFYNLMENSLRHGGHVTRICFSFQETDRGGVIIYQDDGIGISPEDKKHLFKRGFGKNTGLGLFLSMEILSITGITIHETGKPGNGARFEILIPRDKYRVRKD